MALDLFIEAAVSQVLREGECLVHRAVELDEDLLHGAGWLGAEVWFWLRRVAITQRRADG